MVFELSTHFDESEKRLLMEYEGFEIKLTVQSDTLFYDNGVPILTPRRMIGDGEYYLLEVADELNEWYMGVRDKNLNYVFWGPYRNLETALKSL